jgi:hypothetical protein
LPVSIAYFDPAVPRFVTGNIWTRPSLKLFLSACSKPSPTQSGNDVITLLSLQRTLRRRDLDQSVPSTKVLSYGLN